MKFQRVRLPYLFILSTLPGDQMRQMVLFRAGAFSLLLCMGVMNVMAQQSATDSVAATENIYADVLDAYGAFSTIDSGLMKTYDGKDLEAWKRIYRVKRGALVTNLANLPAQGLSKSDARAVVLMRASLSDFPEDASTLSPTHKCQNAQSRDLGYEALRASLYSCFDELANKMEFEGANRQPRSRPSACLSRSRSRSGERSCFLAFNPLWQAVNGPNAKEFCSTALTAA